MKKIIFINVSMQAQLESTQYAFFEHNDLEYDQKVAFPINAVLAKTLNCDDEVKVVLLKINDEFHYCDKNECRFKEELNDINKNIGAKIDYVTLSYPYDSAKRIHEKIMKDVIKQLENDTHIIVDITYGPKPLAIAMFGVLRFAEKFYDLVVDYVVYGQVQHKVDERGKTHPQMGIIYDVSTLYYLISLTDKVDCQDAETALKLLDLF